MKLLIIDTSKQTAFVIAKCDENSYVKVIPETKRHSEELLNTIEELLSELNLTLNSFDALCGVTGPGSFTGIRIGLATIKAFLCANNNIKCLASNYFECVAKSIKNGTAVIKNTGTSCYLAQIKNGQVSNQKIVNYADFNGASSGDVYALQEEHLEDALSYINLKIIDNYANILINHFVSQYKGKKFISINDLSPYYMQASQAERELEERTNDKKTN